MAGKESHFQLALKTSVGSADHAERWDLGDRCVQGELSLATRSIRAEAEVDPGRGLGKALCIPPTSRALEHLRTTRTEAYFCQDCPPARVSG